jgi:hypothetical protein
MCIRITVALALFPSIKAGHEYGRATKNRSIYESTETLGIATGIDYEGIWMMHLFNLSSRDVER